MKFMLLATALLALLPQTASAQYQGWQHSGALYILTTPEGANLPATVSEEGFPLLVRLNKGWFDFSQAQAHGEDIRFTTSSGAPLAYEIDDWNPAAGSASIWVRMPKVRGDARQELRMYWGKADAAAESNAKAVFNESNGYLHVFHMNDPLTDDVGPLEPKDTGTTPAAGMIGKSRHFEIGKGINCGEKITTLPTGSSPNSSEAWFKAENVNSEILGWGNQAAAAKVVMLLTSPPFIRMDCFFSGGNVNGTSRVPLSQWVHVVHTYTKGDSRLYVNGRLDATNTFRGNRPLDIKSPARLYIGGWYNNYKFVGDIDELRISNVARSADWIKMEYENQKLLQTMVGPIVQPGSDFSVSAKEITVSEGKTATVTAKAGGAQKVYWMVTKNGQESVAAVDRFAYTIDAGRVTGDESFTLTFKAVYADAVKTVKIPVTIREDIPDPIFTLKAPPKWDGRETIEVLPHISNSSAMQAKEAGTLQFDWTISGMAVIKQIEPGKLILKRSQNSGKLTVRAAVNNGGKPVVESVDIEVKEPAKDAWVRRTPDKDEKPVENQFYARDDNNEGTLYYNGTLSSSKAASAVEADSVFLKVYAGDQPFASETQSLKSDKRYAFTVKLKPGLVNYKVEFGAKSGSHETVLDTVGGLQCGDAYIIEGQSNAEATAPGRDLTTNPWVRTYHEGWGNAVRAGSKWWIGYWGWDLAANFSAAHHIPICIINGAVGGTRIDEHLRNESDPTDPKTIYGKLLARVESAKLTDGIRGVLWHQGEADQGTLGPTGDYDYKSYQQYFVDMSAAWKQDYPNIQHYYIFQIWPNACTDPSANDMLREVQRTLPRLYSNMRIMTTLGVVPGSSCHYVPAGYARFAALMQPLVERDNYGAVFDKPVAPADLKRAYYTSDKRDEITLEFDQPMVWKDATLSEFYLDGKKADFIAGTATGNTIKLKLAAPAAAKTITYLIGKAWKNDQPDLLYGQNGIAALTFCEVPLEPQSASAKYQGWQHSGELYIVTSPEGANLPSTTSEAGFPLLVRLNKDWFDFSQAQPHGEDIRFTTGIGAPLAYEIDQWDPAAGSASIWVRIPEIHGNARQGIKMLWGNADAPAESNGKKVFNESNGFLSVFHMNDPVADVTGHLHPKDKNKGTTSAAGLIGKSRHFEPGNGITCGEDITTLPTGSNPHSTEAWIKVPRAIGEVVSWGNQASARKLVMKLLTPARVEIDCFYSGGNVKGAGKLPLSQWVHVIHTYKKGDARLYINGKLDGANTFRGNRPMDLRIPARLYIGGWDRAYHFHGDIDELRISNVARSADWIKMEYENQKLLQTMVGPIVQPGSDFSVSAKEITVSEGKTATVTAKAGGAQKVYWMVTKNGQESVAAVDRFAYTIDAGRVTGDESFTLTFKAVYADAVKTVKIPVTIREDIPDPIFTLKAPPKWDGRETIEVLPHISNSSAMQAKEAGTLQFDWTISGMAVIKQIEPGKLILKRSQGGGKLTVRAAVNNGGKPVIESVDIEVKEPAKDAWVRRTPDKDEKPVENQFYARDDNNEGTLYYNGTLSSSKAASAGAGARPHGASAVEADSVFLKVYAGDQLVASESHALKADKRYAFTVKLKPGLVNYKVEFGAKSGSHETVLDTVGGLQCGDAYIIEGQSNAEATAPGRDLTTNPWVRTYHEGWGNAVRAGSKWWIGYWGWDLAANLSAAHHIPICIINGAVGGTRIDEHLRNESDPTDPKTIYGKLLARVEGAKLTDGIRGVLWHQGEADQGTLGPTGDYDYKSYQQYFVDMSAAWKQDYPNIQHYYIFQIWPNACTDPSANDMLREVQRTLPRLYSNMRIMTTLGVVPGSSCHYVPAGYARFAALMQPLVEQDNYGAPTDKIMSAADVKHAYFTNESKDEITLEFDQPMVWKDATLSEFYLDGKKADFTSGSAAGNTIKLKLAAPAAAKTITYLIGKAWKNDQPDLLYGQNGVAALTFCDVPLEPQRARP